MVLGYHELPLGQSLLAYPVNADTRYMSRYM